MAKQQTDANLNFLVAKQHEMQTSSFFNSKNTGKNHQNKTSTSIIQKSLMKHTEKLTSPSAMNSVMKHRERPVFREHVIFSLQTFQRVKSRKRVGVGGGVVVRGVKLIFPLLTFWGHVRGESLLLISSYAQILKQQGWWCSPSHAEFYFIFEYAGT